ncbi:hypothetical protein [Carboxylicivirga sp. RSCT41]|uniref:hypothetical protein n=1 Tax=Carboxylicivirga agarovorans TaxID=3417570 RepID=UPI003D3558CF
MEGRFLKYKIKWKKKTIIKDGYENIESVIEKDIKAYLMKQTGNKGDDNNEKFTHQNLVFKIRNHYNINYTDIIVYDGFEYEIDNILPTLDKQWCELYVSKINT